MIRSLPTLASSVLFVLVIGTDQYSKIVLPILGMTNRLIVPVLLIALSTLYFVSRKTASKMETYAMICIFAGGISNGIDIIAYNHVRDVFGVHNVVFNIADCAIVAGAMLFTFSVLLMSRSGVKSASVVR